MTQEADIPSRIVREQKSVFMRVCKLLHFPTGENGHLPTGENEEKASFAYGGK